MGKNIELPQETLLYLYKLIAMLDDYDLDGDTRELVKQLEAIASNKVHAMKKRRAYIAYKTATTEAERDAKWREYLCL